MNEVEECVRERERDQTESSSCLYMDGEEFYNFDSSLETRNRTQITKEVEDQVSKIA